MPWFLPSTNFVTPSLPWLLEACAGRRAVFPSPSGARVTPPRAVERSAATVPAVNTEPPSAGPSLAVGNTWSCALDAQGMPNCSGGFSARTLGSLRSPTARPLRAIAGRDDLLCALDEAGCVKCAAMYWPRFDYAAQMAAPLCGVDALSVDGSSIVASAAGRRMCSRLTELGYDWQPCAASGAGGAIVATQSAIRCRQADLGCEWRDPLPQTGWWTGTHAPAERLSALLRRECRTEECSTFAPLGVHRACLARGTRVDCFLWTDEGWIPQSSVSDVIESAVAPWHMCVRTRDHRVLCTGNPAWGRVDRDTCGAADRPPFRLMEGPVYDFSASMFAVCAIVGEPDTRAVRCVGDPAAAAAPDVAPPVWTFPQVVQRSPSADRVLVTSNAIRIADSLTGVDSMLVQPQGLARDRISISWSDAHASRNMLCANILGELNCSPVMQFGYWRPERFSESLRSPLRSIAVGEEMACYGTEADRVSCFDIIDERRRQRHMNGNRVVVGLLSIAVQRAGSVHVMREIDFPSGAVVVPTASISDFRLHAVHFDEVCGSDSSGQLWCGERTLRPVAGAVVDRSGSRAVTVAMTGSFRCWVTPSRELWCAGHSGFCAINERPVEQRWAVVSL